MNSLKLLLNELTDDDNILLDVCNNPRNSDNIDDTCKLACAIAEGILPPIKKKRNTIKNYCEVVKNYTEKEFTSHFRITRLLFVNLTEKFLDSEIYQKLISTAYSRANISAEKHMLIFLWFAGHQTSSFRDVADRFDDRSSLYDVLTRVMMFLSHMAPEAIKFPSEQEKIETKNFYKRNKSFPNIVGSIDGSHIRIDRPSERPTDYFNRKDYHSVVLQGVCTENLKFLNICVGYPGSVHDARIFRNSLFYTKINELCNGEEYILGDSAYPLLVNLMTPYRDNGHLTAAQKNFNTKFSSCRVTIEHTFGLLKQRFRQLYHLKLKGPDRICHFIRACCVLHNLSIGDNLSFEQEEAVDDNQPESLACQEIVCRDANIIRDAICRNLVRRTSKN